ncbi:non-hydrolyzing UDP-N-acetylglucosamine 2-epimerase [Paenibacillus koleovorans]|uniref:non-hydrolyzing UDP-N-acetylglucosamine 2-epimerase n=1 Tax=Paenibacillus koleovorans TaxID=121608 RepID=UPI000FDA05E6|nr:UDP-N-acetylglucosamine 2-epimerase (non-hydrolyzing) [Paenibacillus koleovorans]
MKRIKIMTIFGTRPEAIKMAPLVLELQKHPEQIESLVCVTAQHREMLDQVLDIFEIKPDYDLDVMKANQTLNEVTVRVLQGLEPVLSEAKPDMILVHGDTGTTFLASFAAYMQKIAVGHVEAGLRTWNKYSPYPEEMNRQLTGVIADLHFAPTSWSADNLRRENKSEATIYTTGNTVNDVAPYVTKEGYTHPVLDWAEGKRLVLMTAHRRENQGEPHRNVFRAVRRLADEFEDIAIVYPVHLSPAVKGPAHEMLGNHPRIKLVDPLDLVEMYNFFPKTHLILTDSGGIQEEAPSFGIPVLVLRDTTERPEGIDAGTLELVGTDEELIYSRAKTLLTDAAAYSRMSNAANPYGDGQASRRIVEGILYHFGRTAEKPEPFQA